MRAQRGPGPVGARRAALVMALTASLVTSTLRKHDLSRDGQGKSLLFPHEYEGSGVGAGRARGRPGFGSGSWRVGQAGVLPPSGASVSPPVK